MAKKRGTDEKVVIFALKVVGPLALLFIAAIMVDFSHMVDWAHSSTPDPLSGVVSALIHPNF
jgi:hypothetical protein